MLSPEVKKAEEYKQLGNKAYKDRLYTKAIEYYTKAIGDLLYRTLFICIRFKSNGTFILC